MPSERLDSWKQIAAYLKRDIRTVQRWEKSEGLPVHRHHHLKRGSAFAFTDELDQWWQGRGAELAVQGDVSPVEALDENPASDDEGTSEPLDAVFPAATAPGVAAAGVELADLATASPARPGRPLRTFALPFGTAALVLALAVTAALSFLTPTGAVHDHPTQRLQVLAPPDTRIAAHPAISPDGRSVAFVGVDASGAPHLWIRRLDSLEAHLVPATEGAAWPFWSADSRYIAFFAGGKLKRTDLEGRPPRIICDAPNGRGGTWSGDRIVFAPFISGPLHEVSASGGVSHPVTHVDAVARETAHRWPHFLPGGDHLIFFVLGTADVNGIYTTAVAGTPERPQHRRLLANNSSAVYAGGHLLFWQDGGLAAQRFSPDSQQLRGEVFRVADATSYNQTYRIGPFSASNTGTIVYQRPGRSTNRLVWFDRNGHELSSLGPQMTGVSWLALSPDQRQVAIQRFERDSQEAAIWLGDLERGGWTRFMAGVLGAWWPIWSPDSHRIAFSLRGPHGLQAIFEKDVASTVDARPLLQQPTVLTANDWSPDGRLVLFTGVGVEQKRHLAAVTVDGAATVTALAPSTSDEISARFSPDMHWMAYVSNESDRFEVYVQPYPPTGQRFRVSSDGGFQPRWRQDGRELFFLSADRQLMAAPVTLSPDFHIGTPHVLFEAPVDNPATAFAGSYYDVSADGQRFLVSRVTGNDSDSIAVVLNWTGLLTE